MTNHLPTLIHLPGKCNKICYINPNFQLLMRIRKKLREEKINDIYCSYLGNKIIRCKWSINY